MVTAIYTCIRLRNKIGTWDYKQREANHLMHHDVVMCLDHRRPFGWCSCEKTIKMDERWGYEIAVCVVPHTSKAVATVILLGDKSQGRQLDYILTLQYINI